MSGCAVSSQARTLVSRALIELTFHVATLTTIRNLRDQATEKELPQPQDEAAFGFLIWKAAPIMSSTKSISAPLRRSSEVSSTTTCTPSRSNTTSPSWRVSSKLKPYWKPEQPPPDTATRRKAPAASSWALRKAMRRAPLSLTPTRRSTVVPPSGMENSRKMQSFSLCYVGKRGELSNERPIGDAPT